MIFRATWPITDPTVGFLELLEMARQDLPALLTQAHARRTGLGRYTVAHSIDIPGSGRTTEWVLLFQCPATRTDARPYHRTATTTGARAA